MLEIDDTMLGKENDSVVYENGLSNGSQGSLNNIRCEQEEFAIKLDNDLEKETDSAVKSEESCLGLLNQEQSSVSIVSTDLDTTINLNSPLYQDKIRVTSHTLKNFSTTPNIQVCDDSNIEANCDNSQIFQNSQTVPVSIISPQEANLNNITNRLISKPDSGHMNDHLDLSQNETPFQAGNEMVNQVYENDSMLNSDSQPIEEAEMTEEDFLNELGIPSQGDLTLINKPTKVRKDTLKHKKLMEVELQNIHSESQRLTRESEIRLPYHKPKIYSLSEFLNRKSLGKENCTIIPLTPKVLTEAVIPQQNETPPNLLKPTDFKTPKLSDFKKKLLKETKVANLVPSLGIQSEFVEFEIDETDQGLTRFMNQFIRQNQKPIATPQIQEVKLHLVCKDVGKNGTEDLKSKEITVKINHETGPTPVNTAKFKLFKEQLLSEVSKKKKEKQQSRLVAYELDNEEGFDDEEEEISDEGSDENEKSDEELSDLEDFLGRDKHDTAKNNLSPFKQTDESLKLVLEESEIPNLEDITCNSTPKQVKMLRMNSGKLFLEDSDDENSQYLDACKQIHVSSQCNSQKLYLEDSEMKPELKKSDHELDSSFEIMGSLFPAYQPGGGLKYGGHQVTDDDAASETTTPVKRHTVSGAGLFDDDSDINSACNSPMSSKLPCKDNIGFTQNVNELLELCSGRFKSLTPNSLHKSTKSCDIGNSILNTSDSPGSNINGNGNTQNVNELLELCSGKFPSSTQELPGTGNIVNSIPAVTKITSVFGEEDIGNTQNHNELIALCSGKFSSPVRNTGPCKEMEKVNGICDSAQSQNLKNEHVDEDKDEDDDNIFRPRKRILSRKLTKLSFEIDSDLESDSEITEKDSPEKNFGNKNVDEIEFQTDSDIEKDDEVSDNAIDGSELDFPKPNLMKATDFFDEEAELSGSDVGSEDEYEGDDDEENIFDDTVPSDEEMSVEELRNQIGRAHLKKMQDEDKKELRFFQEMYLEDGDLHTDGNGRERRFRWRNTDDNIDGADKDNKEAGSGDDDEQNLAEDEKWRIQRFEREKWLQEQGSLQTNEQWTGFKLNKRNKSTPASTQNNSFKSNSPLLIDQPKSFLSRNKDFCVQLAEKFQKQETNNIVGRRSTKNFLFVSKSPSKQTKRSAEPVIIKEAKIRKLNMFKPAVTTSKKSVFNFID